MLVGVVFSSHCFPTRFTFMLFNLTGDNIKSAIDSPHLKLTRNVITVFSEQVTQSCYLSKMCYTFLFILMAVISFATIVGDCAGFVTATMKWSCDALLTACTEDCWNSC